MEEVRLIIAIDGPAGAGKSTIARGLARRLGYLFINTGAMYRAVAWKAKHLGLSIEESDKIGRLAESSVIELKGPVDATRVSIDGEDITSEIVQPEISHAASVVSAIPAVRRALVSRQQSMGASGGVVMEGRDIGTMVFPDAHLKIYLDASVEARAARRFAEELTRGGKSSSLEQIKADIEERDTRDRTRLDSPLVQADDATYLDSSGMTIDEVIETILGMVSAAR